MRTRRSARILLADYAERSFSLSDGEYAPDTKACHPFGRTVMAWEAGQPLPIPKRTTATLSGASAIVFPVSEKYDSKNDTEKLISEDIL